MPDTPKKGLPPPKGILKKINLPAMVTKIQVPSTDLSGGRRPAPVPKGLPNAAIVYGVAAALFAIIALCSVILGNWFTGVMVLVLGLCFLGFALYFIKNN